jgi:hypothetical protein
MVQIRPMYALLNNYNRPQWYRSESTSQQKYTCS